MIVEIDTILLLCPHHPLKSSELPHPLPCDWDLYILYWTYCSHNTMLTVVRQSLHKCTTFQKSDTTQGLLNSVLLFIVPCHFHGNEKWREYNAHCSAAYLTLTLPAQIQAVTGIYTHISWTLQALISNQGVKKGDLHTLKYE